MIIERLYLVTGIALSIVVLYFIIRRLQFDKVSLAAGTIGFPGTSNESLQLIYFWSTQCHQCQTVQTPIIDSIENTISENKIANNRTADNKTGISKISISKVNVSDYPELANEWGIKTVPTTYVLNRAGNVLHINNGLATRKTLIDQLTQ